MFSFVLKTEVLKEWGAFPPIYGLDGVKTPIEAKEKWYGRT